MFSENRSEKDSYELKFKICVAALVALVTMKIIIQFF